MTHPASERIGVPEQVQMAMLIMVGTMGVIEIMSAAGFVNHIVFGVVVELDNFIGAHQATQDRAMLVGGALETVNAVRSRMQRMLERVRAGPGKQRNERSCRAH